MSRSHRDQRRRDDHQRKGVEPNSRERAWWSDPTVDDARYGNTRKVRARVKVKDRRRERHRHERDGDNANARAPVTPWMPY